MTPEQAGEGFVELDLPDGGRVLVRFADEVSNPDIEASVVLMMLAATGSEAEVRAAIADYAESSGLTAWVSADRGSVTVVIS